MVHVAHSINDCTGTMAAGCGIDNIVSEREQPVYNPVDALTLAA